LILAIEIDGKITIMVKSLELKNFEKNAISKPNKGKLTTKKELDKIVEEKTLEFYENKKIEDQKKGSQHR